MDIVWKASACALVTVIITITLGKKEKDIAVLISLAGCILIAVSAIGFLRPVYLLIKELEELVSFRSDVFQIVIKAVGICILTELTSTICQEGGCSGIGKMIQYLGAVSILWMSIPAVHTLLRLAQEIMGEI